MEKASYQCVAMDNIPTDEKQQGMMSSPAIVLSPIWKLTPGNHSGKRSNLYDSYELQAVTKQLNRAIRGSKSPLSPYSYYMKSSPFCSKRMNCIFGNNATTTKRISGLQLNAATYDLNMNEKGNRGIVLRLWKKIKYGLTRSKSIDN